MAEEGDFLIKNVLIPVYDKGPNDYGTFDVFLSGGTIASVTPSTPETAAAPPPAGAIVVDGTRKMLLPGFVNGHAHSIEHWGRGLVKPLPLELWVDVMYKCADPRSSIPNCPAHKVYLTALACGIETVMTGGTAIMDHLFCRDIDDVEAAVNAYKKIGLRAFIAPMLADEHRDNYFPLVGNAKELNKQLASEDGPVLSFEEGGPKVVGLADDGKFREEFPPNIPADTERVMQLWTDAVEKFHDPENGINIAIGPMQNYSCSDTLMERCIELRKKHNLCGHIHLLESRAHVLNSRQKYPGQGVVKRLEELGWLQLPGTSCAHCVWLSDEDQEILAKHGAAVVHNPCSNTRLGSGIAPIKDYAAKGVTVAIGCDGACSNDSQDLLEAVKLSCILSPLTTPEYRKWATPRDIVRMASEGGATVIGMKGRAGAIQPGYVADLNLYDLTTLCMLPRTDPVGLLVLGRPCSGPGGNTLTSVWVRGRRILADGVPLTVDLAALREELQSEQPDYKNPDITDTTGNAFENEYRAALGLEGTRFFNAEDKEMYGNFPEYRVNYPANVAP
eukprot:TRINITY_DN22174_c0_g1_i1.p1 TRINITY_DN22174_c0_g1~~TRINITY_DN22174_c0_g1_i1.p1  ORF type:complete len:560 (+),score=93.64 TRINITY_DN22174_c0_g1_i1:139-1818(+)